MRKYIAILFLIILQLVINSCKSQKLTESNSFEFFQVEQFNDNSLKLIKKPTSLSVDNDVIKESGYSIVVAKDIKKLSSKISTIPNETIFEFSSGQKVFIMENTSQSKEYSSLGLNKEKFIKELSNLKVSNSKLDSELETLKKDRFFGIRIINEYLVIYVNVKSDKKEQFNKTLQSFELK